MLKFLKLHGADVYLMSMGIALTDWLAKSNSLIAWILGVMTLIYMGYKIYNLHLDALQKKKDLKK